MSSKCKQYLGKLKNYIYGNKGQCILISVVFILVCLNVYQSNNIRSLKDQLDDAWYKANMQNNRIEELQRDMNKLKSEFADLSNAQSSLYSLNQRTTDYNIDKLKDAHNELVKFIECLGKSFCYPSGSLVTLY